MDNKVLVSLNIPEIDKDYDIYLPVNKKIGNIICLLNKAINELSDGVFPISEYNCLYNAETSEIYSLNVLLINTDIRNGTRLVLIS